MMSHNKKTLPETVSLFFTTTGFGVKSVSKKTLRKNFVILKEIAKEASDKAKSLKGKSETEQAS